MTNQSLNGNQANSNKTLSVRQKDILFVGGPDDGMLRELTDDRRKTPTRRLQRCVNGYTLIANTDTNTSSQYPMVYHYSPSNDTRRK